MRNVQYRIAASAKITSNKTGRKKFFLNLFLLSETRATRFSPSADVITFWRLIHLGQAKVRLSKRSKINNTRSRRLQRE
jgi:hypothetical protein